jgi:hypothetical protein
MKLIRKLSLYAFIAIHPLLIFSQEPDPLHTGKALFESAYRGGTNIEAGVGAHNFLIMDGKAKFGSKLKLIPNTYEYYVGSAAISKMENSGNYIYTGFRLGKRMYRNTPLRTDTVSMTNASSIDFYFLGATVLFPQFIPIAKHTYWSWNPGVYLDFIIGNLKPEIKNGSLEADMVIVNYSDSPQSIRPLDFGLALNFEFGFRAAYTGISIRTGLRNLAPKDTDMTIRNNGMINFYIGYRFESEIAKEDQKRINNIAPR